MKVTIKRLEIEHAGLTADVDFDAEDVAFDNGTGQIALLFKEIPELSKILRKVTEYIKIGSEIIDSGE